MLRSMNDLENYAIHATDGDVGQVKDFYFDDQSWVIRYLVVDTGGWLSSRKVLISPIGIGHPNWADRVLPVSVTKRQVKNSPHIDTEKPISRQHEIPYLGYYGYPAYWDGAGLWGAGMIPGLMMPSHPGFERLPGEETAAAEKAYARADAARHENDDPHLRSCKAIIGYHIHATDGDIGHVQALLVDEETWAIRYMVVNTSNWWLDHQVLVAPQWIKEVGWGNATVAVDLTRQAVQEAPPYDSAGLLNRLQEMGIYDHYSRAGYWGDTAKQDVGTARQ